MPSPKDGTNDQWGLASSTGARSGVAFPPLAVNDGGPPLLDLNGQQWVRQASAPPPVPGFGEYWANRATVLTNDVQVFPLGPALLDQITGFVEASSDDAVNYVQLYDILATPTVEVPLQSIRVVGSQEWAWAPLRLGFADGLRLCISSSPLSFVAGDLAFYNALGWQP